MDAEIIRLLADVLVLWFHDHYEDPAESMPVHDGEFVWMVEPHDARDVLDENFAEMPDAVIHAAWQMVTEGGLHQWVDLEELHALG